MIGLLIRHGHAEPVGRWLAGRRAGVLLNAVGREQTQELVNALKWAPLSAVYTSPLERAVETAHPLASDHGLDVRVRPALTDVDFGDWTGRTLDDLSQDAAWVEFTRDRGNGKPPRGEPLAAVQQRIVDELMTLAKSHQGETIAIVTHDEPIRCALAAFGDSTMDDVMAVELEPTRICAIGITAGVRRVLGVNVPANEVAV